MRKLDEMCYESAEVNEHDFWQRKVRQKIIKTIYLNYNNMARHLFNRVRLCIEYRNY